MASYCSLLYVGIFLPAVVLCYAVVPQRHRGKVLLAASYASFWSVSGKLIVFLLASSFSLHHFGLWLTHVQEERDRMLAAADKAERKAVRAAFQRRLRRILLFAVLLHIGTLVTLKYAAFFSVNLNRLLDAFRLPFTLPVPAFLLPIGISFYSLQAVSYLIDVYRGTVRADRNLGRLMLFLGFFPQIMEGPICRYGQTALPLWEGRPLTWKNLTFGMQRILFGMMKKIVIADRLNILIKNVFSSPATFDGGITALAMVCYTCQLYMEFSGTMDVVIGSAEIFGIRLPENFRQPFFSASIQEFWMRWHITLGAWFKDYIFYPLSMSGPLKKLTGAARRRLGSHFGPLLAGSVALFAVWLCNGLWHGAGWQYIFFGLYHFALILCGSLTAPLSQRIAGALHIDRDAGPWRMFRIARTALLVCVGELFFRADGLRAGLSMFRRMVTDFSLRSFTDGTFLGLGMDKHDFFIVIVAVLLVFAVGLMRERGISLREAVARQHIAVRWSVYYAAILFVIIFGAYGIGYVPVDPIYAAF